MNAAIERQLKQLKQQTKEFRLSSRFQSNLEVFCLKAACNGVTCLSSINAVRKNGPRKFHKTDVILGQLSTLPLISKLLIVPFSFCSCYLLCNYLNNRK